MEEAADSKKRKGSRLLPCSSVTSDDDSFMETSDNVHEENERVEKSARVQVCDNNIEPRDDADIQKVALLIEKRRPVPPNYDNCSCPFYGNLAIRFDGLRPDADDLHLMRMIPPQLRNVVSRYCGVYPDDLNGKFGFVEFESHEIAKNFIQWFNGKKFHNPDINYNLSWAPFHYGKCEKNVDLYEEKTNSESGNEAELDIDSDSDSEADSSSDSEADSDCDSEADSNIESSTDSGTIVFDSESVKEAVDEQFLSRKETVEESQARKAKQMLEEKLYEDFYIRLDKEFHESGGSSWPWPAFEDPPEVFLCSPGGCASSILYLYRVDPLVEKEDLERIFGKYGPCSVNLPYAAGFGYVEFVERKSAVQAYKKLYFAMQRLRICCFSWGVRVKRMGDSKEDKPIGGPKDDGSCNSPTGDNALSDYIWEREELTFLHCPLLGSECTQNTLKWPSFKEWSAQQQSETR